MNRNTKGKIKKVLTLCLALITVLSFAVSTTSFADDFVVDQEAVNGKQSELSDINSDLSALEKELKAGKNSVKTLASQIKVVEGKIYSEQQRINKLNSNINNTKEKIAVELNNLMKLEQDIDNHSDELNQRVRTMYKNGNIGILSVLFGSHTMSDFLTNVEMAKRIYRSDQDLLVEMQETYKAIFEKKEELAALKENLLSQQDEASKAKALLSDSEDKLAKQKKSVESNNKTLEAQIDSLNAEADKLVAEIRRLQGHDAYTGGQMSWPSQASTRVTSNFGMRMHPILKVEKLHTGIDIGAAAGTDILAANDGKVIKATYNENGYGYYLMIDHGGGIVTLYAHSSKLLVSVGDRVTRGQVIAKVGSTGMSTGPHLHFEVRIDGEYKDPLGYVTPGKY